VFNFLPKELFMKNAIKIIAFLSVIAIIGCSNDSGGGGHAGNDAQGKLLILQAYGNAGDGSPGGVSHSFVELYNISDEAINLNGISLYYANGIRGENVTEDEPWQRIALNGTIPANGSFLILGKKHDDLSGTRYTIDDDYCDINDDELSLSRRGFKAVLIKSSTALSVQNPFTANGKPVSGYIDMVGALNNPDASPPDNIFGYETAPARNSASVAVRRVDLTDTDDNSTDFEGIRYASGGITDEELEVRKPRNSVAGAWDPFEESAEPQNPTVVGAESEYAGKLLIWQAGAATDGAIGNSFIELYNTTNSEIDLSAFSLQYGTTGTNWGLINLTGKIPSKHSYLVIGDRAADESAIRLDIDQADQTVPGFQLNNSGFKIALMANQHKLTVDDPFKMTGGKAAGYIDVLGAWNSSASAIDACETTAFSPISKQASARRKSLTDTNVNSADFVRIDYRTSGTTDTELTLLRPKSAHYGEWNPVTGVKKDKPPTDVTITGAGVSSGKLGLMKEAVVTLSAHLVPVDADTAGLTYSWAVSPAGVLTYGSTTGSAFTITASDMGTATVTLTVSGVSGNKTDSIQVTVSTGTEQLMILQVYGAGFGSELGSNDNTNTGSISHNFIELYNNTNLPIDLSTYSVQWANGKANGGGTVIAEDEDWNVIPLTGTIPAYGSYLIRGRKMNDQDGDVGRLQVSQGDIDDDDFYMSNRSFKVALVSNQTKINMSQPWDNATEEPLINGLLDLVGARNGPNDSVEGFKGAMFDTYSKQQSIRRGSLDDTENNKNDFVGLDYRNWSAGYPTRLTDDQVVKYRPRTAAASGYIPQF
jgi:hypothetical protein